MLKKTLGKHLGNVPDVSSKLSVGCTSFGFSKGVV
jgi:hypothetical protein